MLQKKLGQRLAELRKSRHWPQMELAEWFGSSVEVVELFTPLSRVGLTSRKGRA